MIPHFILGCVNAYVCMIRPIIGIIFYASEVLHVYNHGLEEQEPLGDLRM